MQRWKVPPWATWLCLTGPSLLRFQLSSMCLTWRYLSRTAHWWRGGGETSSSPAGSNSVHKKLQNRSSRIIWASFISEVRLNASVDAKGAVGGWGMNDGSPNMCWCWTANVNMDPWRLTEPRGLDRRVLPQWSTASVLTPLHVDLTGSQFSQTLICPHPVPLFYSSHFLIFLFKK